VDVRDYRPRQQITIHYDPARPYDSVLHFDANLGNYLALLIWLPFVLIGVHLVRRGLAGESMTLTMDAS
jgi:hypothetical protein